MSETEMISDQPFLRVTKGRLDDGELAALTVALLALAQDAPAAGEAVPGAAPVPRAVPRWWRYERSRGFTPAISWRAAA